MLRIALRQGRGGLIAATLIAAINGVAQSLGYSVIAGDTPQARAIFAAQMELLGSQLTFLLPVPRQADTLAGFLQWRHFGSLPLVFGVWALLAATGAGRGDEERGHVEQWLAAGLSRARYLLARVAAFAVLALIATAVTLATALAGATAARDTLPLAGLAGQGVALFALLVACHAVGLLVSQVAVTGRAAAGLGAAVLGALFLVAGAARSGSLEALAPLSPFWQFERSRPLLAGGTLDLSSIAALLGGAGAAVALSLVLWLRRDVGGSALPRRVSRDEVTTAMSARPALRIPVLRGLDRQTSGLLAWAIGLGALGAFMGTLLPTMIRVAKDVPFVQLMILRGGAGDLDSAFVGAAWGSSVLLLLAIYAISQVAAWVADETEGRLEMALSAPVPRWRVVLERAVTLLAGATILVIVASGVLAAVARSSGLTIDLAKFAGAAALLVPLVVAIGGIGALLIGWRPRVAVWVLGAVTVLSYFIQQLGPMFSFPSLVRDLSLFELYGQPLVQGPNWPGLWTELAIIAGGFGLAALVMGRRDITR